jgi:hypothetical protein
MMSRHAFRLFGLSAAHLLLLPSCSSSSGAHGAGANGNAGGGACQPVMVCNLVSASDLNSALVTSFPPGNESDSDQSSGTEDSCEFFDPASEDAANVDVDCDNSNPNGQSKYDSWTGLLQSHYASVVPVDGLGSAAYWAANQSDAGLSDYQLVTFFGASSLVLVTFQSLPNSPTDLESAAKQLTSAVLSKM